MRFLAFRAKTSLIFAKILPHPRKKRKCRLKIITYSDIHLEIGKNYHPPADIEGDVMLLAGDIINFKHYNPLKFFLKFWDKPVIYIAGNHEYYDANMDVAEKEALKWIGRKLPNVNYLKNSAIEIDGVHFFGGTMWTDFDDGNYQAMRYAQQNMNDYAVISCKLS